MLLATFIITGVLFFFLFYFKKEWAFLVIAASFPFPQQFVIFGAKVTLPAFLLSVAFFAWVTGKIIKKEWKFKKNCLDIPFIVLIFAVLISVINAVNRRAWLIETIHLFQLIAVYYLVVNTITNVKIAKRFLFVFFAVMFMQSVYGIVQYLTQIGPEFITEGGRRIIRASGTMGLQFPVYLFSTIPIAGIFFIGAKTKREKILFSFLLCLLGIALFFTLVRGGWLSGFLGILSVFILALIKKIINLKKVAVIGVAILLFSFLILSLFPETRERVSKSFPTIFARKEIETITKEPLTGAQRTLKIRAEFWREAWNMFKKHPFTGVGFNNYSEFLPDRLKYMEGQSPYNIFLRFLAETGIIGFTGWVLLLFFLFRAGFRNIRNFSFLKREMLSIGLLGVMFAWLGQSLWGIVIVGGAGTLYFFLMGLLVACGNMKND